jgi:hypothetical protein
MSEKEGFTVTMRGSLKTLDERMAEEVGSTDPVIQDEYWLKRGKELFGQDWQPNDWRKNLNNVEVKDDETGTGNIPPLKE